MLRALYSDINSEANVSNRRGTYLKHILSGVATKPLGNWGCKLKGLCKMGVKTLLVGGLFGLLSFCNIVHFTNPSPVSTIGPCWPEEPIGPKPPVSLVCPSDP